MSGNGVNGNGKTGAKTGNGHFQVGDDPRRGHGLKGRSGRPASEIREKLRGAAWKRIKELERLADEAESESDRLRAMDLMLKYGIGSMTTGTLDVNHRTIDDVLLERARRRELTAG